MNIMEKYKALALVGKPGCGKGTQGAFFAKEEGFETFSSGQQFRRLSERGDELAARVTKVMNEGGLMPHWFASFVFQEKALYTPVEQGIIFDGVARKAPEAELFHDVMKWLSRPYKVICLDVSDEEIMARLAVRRKTQNRTDDSEEAIRVRFEQFREETVPAIQVFEKYGTLIHVNGEQEEEKVFEEMREKLQAA